MDKIRKIILGFILSLVLAWPQLGWCQESGLFDLKNPAPPDEKIENMVNPFDGSGPFGQDESIKPQTNQTTPQAQAPVVKIEETKPAQPPIIGAQADTSQEDLISINFENVDIRDVIRILANKAQTNMVVGPEITATVNIQLNNVPWEKALSVILSTYGLAYKKEEGLIRIMTLDQLQSEQEKTPLETKILVLNFARANEVKSNFSNMLSSRGRIDVNDRTNSLIITDIPDNIKKIEEISVKLDTRTPQVLIEALIADVSIIENESLGIDWTLTWPDVPAYSPDPKRALSQTLGYDSQTLFKFGTTILTNKDLHAWIGMMQRQSRANVLAHPTIVTLDNLTANIALTDEIAYQQQTTSTQSGSAVETTAFKTAGITLAVTPHVTTKDNYIYLALNVTQSHRTDTVNGQPVIGSRSAQTNLLVKDGHTAIIGGLTKKNDSFATRKVPFLGDIPMLGSLFRNKTEDSENVDLMIFVTPKIIEERELTLKEKDRLNLFEEKPEDWQPQFDLMRNKNKSDSTKQTKLRKIKSKPEALSISESKKMMPEETIYLRPPVLGEDN